MELSVINEQKSIAEMIWDISKKLNIPVNSIISNIEDDIKDYSMALEAEKSCEKIISHEEFWATLDTK